MHCFPNWIPEKCEFCKGILKKGLDVFLFGQESLWNISPDFSKRMHYDSPRGRCGLKEVPMSLTKTPFDCWFWGTWTGSCSCNGRPRMRSHTSQFQLCFSTHLGQNPEQSWCRGCFAIKWTAGCVILILSTSLSFCDSVSMASWLSWPTLYSWARNQFLHLDVSIEMLNLPSTEGFPGSSDGKESACNAGDQGSIPGLGRSPGEGSGNPLQYSCLENPLDRGALWATVHGVAKSWTQMSN